MIKQRLCAYFIILLLLIFPVSLAEQGQVAITPDNFWDYFSYELTASTSSIDYKSSSFTAEYQLVIHPIYDYEAAGLQIALKVGDVTFEGVLEKTGDTCFEKKIALQASDYSGVSAYMTAITSAASKAISFKEQALETLTAQGLIIMPLEEAEGINARDYHHALSLQQQGNTEEALAILDRLAMASYSDSAEMARQFRDQRTALYAQGITAMDNKDYLSAKAIWEGLGDYEDAKALALEAHYRHGQALLEQGAYDEAAAVFSQISGYEEADTLLLEARYQKAEALMKKEEYEAAAGLFLQIADYRDAKERPYVAWFRQGEKELALENGENALLAFEKAQGYSGAREGMKKAYLLLAGQAMAKKEWDQAASLFMEAGEKSRAGEPYIAKGDELMQAGRLDEALAAYETALEWAHENANEKIGAVHYQKGLLAQQEGRWQDAISAYELLPGNAGAQEGLLLCRYELANAAAQGLYYLAKEEYLQAGAYGDAYQKALSMAAKQADALAQNGQYTQAYLLYQSMMTDEIKALIKEDEALSNAAKAWKKSIKKGARIPFGFYETDQDPLNGPEALEWLVLTVTDNNKALLLCVSLKDAQKFMEDTVYVTWKHSDLRAWLNNDLLSSAFSPAQQSAIQETQVKAIKEDHTEVSPGNHTIDRLFCLNAAEYNKYIAKDKKMAAALAECNLPAWWLRSPGKSMGLIMTVQQDGSTLAKCAPLRMTACPAMWIDLNNELFK